MKQLEKDITTATDREYLIELDKYLDKDIINVNEEVNKVVIMHTQKFSEEQYQSRKKQQIDYFNKLKNLISERLKELTHTQL